MTNAESGAPPNEASNVGPGIFHSAFSIRHLSFSLDLVHGPLAQPGAVFYKFELGYAADHVDRRAVVQILGLRALEPDPFTFLRFRHTTIPAGWQLTAQRAKRTISR
jgi:hypothetical protein